MKTSLNHNFAHLQLHLSVFLFGFAGLFGKWIELDAISIVWGRVFFASLGFLAYFIISREKMLKISWKNTIVLFFLGALLAFHWWSFFEAIQLSTVALALLSFASFPVFTAIIESFYLKSLRNYKTVLLVLLSSAGIYLILPEWSWKSDYFKGVFWGLWSGFSFALLTILNRYLQKSITFFGQKGSLKLSFYQDFFACLILSPFIGFAFTNWSVENWMLLAILGLAFTALAHFLFINSLRHINAFTAALSSNMEAVYAIVLAAIFLGEKLDSNHILGGVLILSSTILSAYFSKK